ncbi:hypothetical protein [Pseudaestuariivita sp.]|uniref:hypothetical protein n=1 Tax=Pseudaestuariivita sp. TaxID=2211669 RepID=UPI004058E483
MASLYQKIAHSLDKRAKYNRTVAEIEAMPLDVALDLDIHRGDAHRLAHEAVYGG